MSDGKSFSILEYWLQHAGEIVGKRAMVRWRKNDTDNEVALCVVEKIGAIKIHLLNYHSGERSRVYTHKLLTIDVVPEQETKIRLVSSGEGM